jgi:hypothetical protein
MYNGIVESGHNFQKLKMNIAVNLVVEVAPRLIQFQGLFFFLQCVNPYLFSSFGRLSPAMKSYWSASMISTIVATYICCEILSVLGKIDVHDANSTDPVIQNAIYTFMGYLASDFFMVLRNPSWPGANVCIVHHIVTFGIMVILICSTLWPPGLMAQGLLAEFTNPFVNQVFFFKTADMKDSPLFRLNAVLIMVFFFIFRIVNLGMIVLWFFTEYDNLMQSNAAVAKLNSFFFGSLYFLQWIWFYKIVRGCAKQF